MTACLGEPNHVTRLEHAQARLTLSYNRRGDLAIHLVSPMGTRSTLLAARCSPCPFAVLLPDHRHFISKTPASIRDPGGGGSCVLWDSLITGILAWDPFSCQLCVSPCEIVPWLRTSGKQPS